MSGCIYLLLAHGCIFPKRLERPEMLCELSSVNKATASLLKVLLGLVVTCTCLEVSGC